jgi:restriction system protein
VDLRVVILAGVTLTGAKLEGVRITSEDESTFSTSFLDLATAEGLHDVDPTSRGFVEQYVSRVLDYIASEEIPETEEGQTGNFFRARLAKIRALRRLFSDSEEPPHELVKVVEVITNELIGYLRSHPNEMNNIRPRQFEELIAEILASYGWDVQLTPEARDGGYDIFAISKDNAGVQTSWIIECKKYAPHRKVGVDIARSLFGVKGDLNVGMSMLATTSYFTKGVNEYKASRYDLELKDYEGVLKWINEYRPNPNGRLYLKGNRLVLPGDEE